MAAVAEDKPVEVVEENEDDDDMPELEENTGDNSNEGGADEDSSGGKQNRSEKKARKAIQKLCREKRIRVEDPDGWRRCLHADASWGWYDSSRFESCCSRLLWHPLRKTTDDSPRGRTENWDSS